MPLYQYVGPRQIADRSPTASTGTPIRSVGDVVKWVRESDQHPSSDGCLIATFVVDQQGVLLVADRHSEHVACAGRQSVRSAGEITFRRDGDQVEVAAVSNQSTGYCPEPESWPAVAAALVAAGLEPPEGFALACIFRLCPQCGCKNLVKGGVFECGVCMAELPTAYNCQGQDVTEAELFGRPPEDLSMEVVALIEESKQLYSAAGLDCGDALLPPAADADIDAVGEALGLPVPEELRAVWRVHGGQEEVGAGVTGLFGWHRLISPFQTVENHRLYCETCVIDMATFPPAPGAWGSWVPELIPFATFNANDLCVHALSGEVWEFVPGGGLVLHRPSITAVLREVISAVRKGGEAQLTR